MDSYSIMLGTGQQAHLSHFGAKSCLVVTMYLRLHYRKNFRKVSSKADTHPMLLGVGGGITPSKFKNSAISPCYGIDKRI